MQSRLPQGLFDLYELKGLRIKNRLMRSPMVLSMAAPDGTVTDDLLRTYRLAAEGGVGLCCTGCMAVNAEARMNRQQMGAWTDDQIPGLTQLVDTVHAYGEGCVFFAQIFSEGAHSWGYSYGQADAGLDVNSLSDERIWTIIEAFAAAAARVREAGFDGVHLHGGHGYLISQFLSPAINVREDRWGGDLERRCAFAVEICRAVRNRVGTEYPIGIKMNTADYLPGGHWQEDTARVARTLVDAGIDLIEMSGGMGYMIELREALRRRVAEKEYYFWDAIGPFTEALAATGVALAAVGGIRTPAAMEEIRALGIDFISMARPWLCEPDLAKRIQAGDRRPAKCVSSHKLCNLCLTKLGKGSVQCERFYPGDCRMSCPIEQDNPTYMAHIVAGELEAAARVVKADNPLANSLSRVCHSPCETACRGKNGEPLGLRAVKRFVVDWAREHGVATEAPMPHARRRGKVAVVGSGPAGLTCAFHLARLGYQTTVFERESMPGGMLAWGIPAYRLPRDVVAADVHYIVSAGVDIRTDLEIDCEHGMSDLFRLGFAAVFLATGATLRRPLELPGVELSGVVYGLDLLRDLSYGRYPTIGRRVVVIGGGNAAIDSAMTARRLGADEVTLVCLEQVDAMPAYPDQIADAVEEGVIIKSGCGPRKIIGDGSVAGVELARCDSMFDTSGAFNPTYCATDSALLPADTVIIAIGQATPSWSPGDHQANTVGDATTCVASGCLVGTIAEGVFVGGDSLRVGSVVDAMGAGKLGAYAIDRYLAPAVELAHVGTHAQAGSAGGNRFAPYLPMVRPTACQPVSEATLRESSRRANAPKLTPAERERGFAEIVGAITKEQAVAQACQCLKHDLQLEAESAARLAQMGPASFVLAPVEDERRKEEEMSRPRLPDDAAP